MNRSSGVFDFKAALVLTHTHRMYPAAVEAGLTKYLKGMLRGVIKGVKDKHRGMDLLSSGNFLCTSFKLVEIAEQGHSCRHMLYINWLWLGDSAIILLTKKCTHTLQKNIQISTI